MNLFDLFVKIGVDDQASKKISSLTSKLGGGLSKAAKVGAAAVGAVTAATGALHTAITVTAGSVASYGDNIDKMSQKMGMSAEAYQEWDAVMQHSGTSIESLQAGMKTLANAVENGNGAVCDCCGIEIKSKDVVSVHGDMLHEDPRKASTGCMSRLGSCHMLTS